MPCTAIQYICLQQHLQQQVPSCTECSNKWHHIQSLLACLDFVIPHIANARYNLSFAMQPSCEDHQVLLLCHVLLKVEKAIEIYRLGGYFLGGLRVLQAKGMLLVRVAGKLFDALLVCL